MYVCTTSTASVRRVICCLQLFGTKYAHSAEMSIEYLLAMNDLKLPMQLNSSVFRSPHLALRLSKSEMPLLMSELNAISTS